MKSRITLVVAALAALAAVPAVAQNPQGPPGGRMGPGGFAQRRMEMLLNGITLTDAQKAKIDSIQAGYRSKMPAFTPGQMPDSATRAQRFELMRQQDMDIRNVLSTDQQAIWDKNVADMQARMPRRPPGE
ncbi:MAG TPA: Spy/CpxP family protein refolding chaperone [Gemmatimonadales bacterium]|nr:Spy/CpxP family protein refolding chaperone [Gemmatimonadales bacterium]